MKIAGLLPAYCSLFMKLTNACVGERAFAEATYCLSKDLLSFKGQSRGDPRGEAVQLHLLESRQSHRHLRGARRFGIVRQQADRRLLHKQWIQPEIPKEIDTYS